MSESESAFDRDAYKRGQHDQWNEDAAAWHRWGPTLQNWHGGVTRKMLDLAEVSRNQQVLDIASGAGEPALSAAERVGPQGRVLATDLAENILSFAQEIAAERGLLHFETQAMDGENLDLPDASFDVVLCRYGLIYMPNRERALKEWHRVLKPGGRAVVAVFSTPDRNDWASVPVGVIRKRAQLPAPLPGQPGPFSLGGEGVFENAFDQAGFRDVEVHKLSAPLRMASAAECTRFAREAFGAFNQMLAHLPREERESIWDEVEIAMRVFEGPQGFEVSCEPLVGVGTKS